MAPAGSWSGYAGDVLLVVAIITLAEELAFRGYVFGLMKDRWGDVAAVTLTALVQQVWQGVNGTTTVAWINGGVSVLLLGLTGVLGVEAVKAWRRPVDQARAPG